MRDRCNEAARIALSARDWNVLFDSASICFSVVAGSGLVLVTLVGKMSSPVEVGVDAVRLGVDTCTVLMRFSCGFFSFELSVAGVVGALAEGDAGLIGGDDARRVSRLERAGSTRLAGVSSVILRLALASLDHQTLYRAVFSDIAHHIAIPSDQCRSWVEVVARYGAS